jgi:large subunit ribosomal protein L32
MGGVPMRHHTSSKVGRRRSHLALKKSNLIACPKCNAANKPHQYCPNCGHYKGRQIIDVMAKLSKKEKKVREKEIKNK